VILTFWHYRLICVYVCYLHYYLCPCD
jgi:hypothetical protein